MFTIYKFDLEEGKLHTEETNDYTKALNTAKGETNGAIAVIAVDSDNDIVATNLSPEYEDDYYEPDVDECGYDPYLGCYTDDC